KKTYNTKDSLVVTDPATSSALIGLSVGERTGSRIFRWVWSYVTDKYVRKAYVVEQRDLRWKTDMMPWPKSIKTKNGLCGYERHFVVYHGVEQLSRCATLLPSLQICALPQATCCLTEASRRVVFARRGGHRYVVRGGGFDGCLLALDRLLGGALSASSVALDRCSRRAIGLVTLLMLFCLATNAG
ncbi:hypothetical protein LY76DRAFT_525337, partial [Colletotrichum caudatum]